MVNIQEFKFRIVTDMMMAVLLINSILTIENGPGGDDDREKANDIVVVGHLVVRNLVVRHLVVRKTHHNASTDLQVGLDKACPSLAAVDTSRIEHYQMAISLTQSQFFSKIDQN